MRLGNTSMSSIEVVWVRRWNVRATLILASTLVSLHVSPLSNGLLGPSPHYSFLTRERTLAEVTLPRALSVAERIIHAHQSLIGDCGRCGLRAQDVCTKPKKPKDISACTTHFSHFSHFSHSPVFYSYNKIGVVRSLPSKFFLPLLCRLVEM